jgi:hypothetical protein
MTTESERFEGWRGNTASCPQQDICSSQNGQRPADAGPQHLTLPRCRLQQRTLRTCSFVPKYTPAMRSLCPPRYFVALSTTMSYLQSELPVPSRGPNADSTAARLKQIPCAILRASQQGMLSCGCVLVHANFRAEHDVLVCAHICHVHQRHLSHPISRGRKFTGLAKVLSMMDTSPYTFAKATIAL